VLEEVLLLDGNRFEILALLVLADREVVAPEWDLGAVRQPHQVGVRAVGRGLDDHAHGALGAEHGPLGVADLDPAHDLGPHGEDEHGPRLSHV